MSASVQLCAMLGFVIAPRHTSGISVSGLMRDWPRSRRRWTSSCTMASVALGGSSVRRERPREDGPPASMHIHRSAPGCARSLAHLQCHALVMQHNSAHTLLPCLPCVACRLCS